MRIIGIISLTVILSLIAGGTLAHVSERALVLILPTEVYITFGVAAVVASVFLTVLTPAKLVHGLFPDKTDQAPPPLQGIRLLASGASFMLFAALLAIGFYGPHDPLSNLLTLVILTGWWICFPLLQAVFGDLWSWINPWSGPVALVFGKRHWLQLPGWLGVWPALASYVLAMIYMLSDIAPDDPTRLAVAAGGYWLFTFLMCGLFGREWLHQGEGFTVMFDLLAQLSPFRTRPNGLQFPGRALLTSKPVQTSLAVFTVSLLAIGSFDGLNETFWWMGKIGINPLEFPGRSAVIWSNRFGLIGAIILLNLLFAACVWLGLALVGKRGLFHRFYCQLALSVLPIALGYHLAHYLTSALVGLQYLLKALNDPFGNGAAWLGMQDFFVTTGFFNQYQTVQQIWLTQAGAIVLAHILAVILAHTIALCEFGSHQIAVISQAPVAGFMVAYTFFGLWLLASPVAL